MDKKDFIAKNAAALIEDNEVVNLGVGIPLRVINHIASDKKVMIHTEAGIIGCGPAADASCLDLDTVDAAGDYCTVAKNGSFCDSAMSFGIIRSGRIDTTILGAFEAAENGDFANWSIPGGLISGTGGAMDLAVGAKKVILTMIHKDKNGNTRILKKCNLPVTARNEANYIVTDLAVMKVEPEGLLVEAMAPGVSFEVLQESTEPTLILSDNVRTMLTSD